MPIYTYKCVDCGEVTEKWFSIKQSKKRIKCEKCSGWQERIISNCNFHLKGDGWYVTDYKKKDKK